MSDPADARPLTEDWLRAIRLNLIADGRLGDRDAKLLLVEVDRLSALLTEREQERDGIQHAYETITTAIAEAVGDGDPSGPYWADGVQFLKARAETAEAQLSATAQARDEALQERDRLQAFVQELAGTPLCDDEPDKCSFDSGPYCGTHLFDAWIVEKARKVRAGARQEEP